MALSHGLAVTSQRNTKVSLTYPDGKAGLTAQGIVRVTPCRNGRWLVEIGRARYVKRLNISRAEAAELVRVLTAVVLTPGAAR
jgi:hypothetical protein